MPSYEVTSMSKPQLPPDATYGERQEYRRDVLLLPGPVDRWLTTNIRTPHINFLKDYLLLADLQTEYVTCSVELVCTKVCIFYFVIIYFRSDNNHDKSRQPMIAQTSTNLLSIPCTSLQIRRLRP